MLRRQKHVLSQSTTPFVCTLWEEKSWKDVVEIGEISAWKGVHGARELCRIDQFSSTNVDNLRNRYRQTCLPGHDFGIFQTQNGGLLHKELSMKTMLPPYIRILGRFS